MNNSNVNPNITLNNGYSMPRIGLGTWKSKNNLVGKAVEYAILEAGYKHIDCASIYGNEKEIGKAFATVFVSGQVERKDVFVTSKLWNADHEPKQVEIACRQTLKDLGLEYLDLYLIHWGVSVIHGKDLRPLDKNNVIKLAPVPLHETWKAMEELVDKGLVRSIGVANFTTTMLIDLLAYARIQPAVNQVELHPYLNQQQLIDFCHYKDIVVTAYSPLGSPGGLPAGESPLLDDKVVSEIATYHKKTPAQIVLKWAMQRNTIPIPKSINLKRIEENIVILDFELSKEEIAKINSLNQGRRFVNPIDFWGIPYFD